MQIERAEIERLVRAGVDAQTVEYATRLMKTFLAPNQPRGEERFTQALRKLALRYRQARELIAAEFREAPPADQ